MSPPSPQQPPKATTGVRSLGRRRLLGLGLAGGAGTLVTAALGGCNPGTRSTDSRQQPSDSGPTNSTQTSRAPNDGTPRVLVAYFSRDGENYYYGDRIWLKVGNTKVVAQMIADTIDCDVHEIKAAEPYPDDYEKTVDRNTAEQNADARPEIANPLPAMDQYDTVLLGSPIWNVRAPMIMSTFIEGLDFSGKTVLPFVTYAVSGLAGVDDDYRAALPSASIGTGLAIRGEKARDARGEVTQWLRRIGLTNRQ